MTSIRNTATMGVGRRLTARSAIASTLLGVSPPVLPTRSLVATVELLGVAPGTARVAMSRMVAAGELAASDDGYRLVGRLLDRQARQEQSRLGPATSWDGTWRTAIVAGEARSAPQRAELRAALEALRHGELREGVWLRPDNLRAGVLPDAEATVDRWCTSLTSRSDDPSALAAQLWDLAGWSKRADDLLGAMAPLVERLERGDADALADGFVLAADALRHLQADPLLPAELTGPTWPGAALRVAQERFDRAFKATLATWLRAHVD